MKPLKKSGFLQTCHSALDAEFNIHNNLEIPVRAGMTFLMIFSKVSQCFFLMPEVYNVKMTFIRQ